MRLILSAILIASMAAALIPMKAVSKPKTITVAVIDTGIDPSVGHLCKSGHKDFTKQPYSVDMPSDAHGHGTHIAGLIVANAGDEVDYCLVSIKYYSDRNTGPQNLANSIAALQYALNIKVDYINYSGGGPETSLAEREVIKKLLARGTRIVAAAGNDSKELKPCNYFPACYDDRIVTVGNLETYNDFRHLSTEWQELGRRAGMGHLIGTFQTRRAPSSNYGEYVKRWEVGTNLKSTLPGGRAGYMSGTSQATAVATGKLLKERGSR